MHVKKIWIIIFLVPTLILFLLIYAIPLVTVFATSFFEWKSYSDNINFIGAKNYIQLFTNDQMFNISLIHTMIWVVLQSTVHVFIGMIVALILSKKPFGWKFVRNAYMIPNIISAAALGIIYLNVFNPQYGVVNSIARILGFEGFAHNWYFDTQTSFVTVTLTWLIFAGLITILIMAEIMSISKSIYESAKMDGATSLQTDIYITLPMIKNILGTCVILAATSMLKEFELIYLTTKGGPGTETLNLPLYIYKTALLENNYGYANTIGTVTIIIGVIIIAFVSKVFRIGNSDI